MLSDYVIHMKLDIMSSDTGHNQSAACKSTYKKKKKKKKIELK